MNQVKGEEYFMPSEEANEVQCLLVEPQNDHVSVDGILCSRDDKLEQCMEIEDVPYRFGGPASNATGEGEDILKPKVLDVMPLEVEGRNCQAENGVSTTCEDYLLDIGYPESVTNLHYDASGRLHFGNPGSDSQIMGFSCRDNVTIGVSDSSTAIILLPQCQNNLPEKTTCELNGNFSCKFVAQTSNEANWLKYPNSESQNVEKMEDVSDLSVTDVSSDGNGNDVILSPGFISSGKSCSSRIAENEEASSVGQGVEAESSHGQEQDLSTKHSVQNSNCSARQKRLRKPTRRYMDESSDLNSRHCLKRQGVSTSTSKDRFLGVRCRKNHHVGSRVIPSSDESFCKAIQVPFSPRGRKECQKKHVSTVMKTSVEESSPDESEDDSVAAVRSEESGGLRKHHKLWTLSEVRKLIDGVSQHGVGKWTQIKKLLFSSSAHRTPVDLKDKWRNLLKASSAQKQSKREDEQRRNQPWRPLPKSMLRRVSELAAIYPYPRGRKFRLSHV